MIRNHFRYKILIGTLTLLAGAPAFALHSGYETYLAQNKCSATKTDACLESTSYQALRSDGRKVTVSGVYQYRDSASSKGVFAPHFILQYMRNLRNAYGSEPQTYGSQLYNQVDFVLSRAVVRGTALVWESDTKYAHAMEQGEMADFLLSAATAAMSKGEEAFARRMATAAGKLIASFEITVAPASGGVRSIPNSCGSKAARARPCYWFHSRGVAVPVENRKHTVLNQDLHAIRDLMSIYVKLHSTSWLPAAAGVTPERVGDLVVGGLYQLAFSAGASSKDLNRPPNMAQFMERKTVSKRNYYWAHYEYLMAKTKPANISVKKTCHYHTHVLNLMADIAGTADRENARFRQLADGWKIDEALAYLWAGAGESVGLSGSLHATYQFYRSEIDPSIKQTLQGCNFTDNETFNNAAFYSAHFSP